MRTAFWAAPLALLALPASAHASTCNQLKGRNLAAPTALVKVVKVGSGFRGCAKPRGTVTTVTAAGPAKDGRTIRFVTAAGGFAAFRRTVKDCTTNKSGCNPYEVVHLARPSHATTFRAPSRGTTAAVLDPGGTLFTSTPTAVTGYSRKDGSWVIDKGSGVGRLRRAGRTLRWSRGGMARTADARTIVPRRCSDVLEPNVIARYGGDAGRLKLTPHRYDVLEAGRSRPAWLPRTDWYVCDAAANGAVTQVAHDGIDGGVVVTSAMFGPSNGAFLVVKTYAEGEDRQKVDDFVFNAGTARRQYTVDNTSTADPQGIVLDPAGRVAAVFDDGAGGGVLTAFSSTGARTELDRGNAQELQAATLRLAGSVLSWQHAATARIFDLGALG